MNLKLTPQLERVLRVFLEDTAAPQYGYSLMKAAKLASGTLYPILTRLETEGVVTSQWETPTKESQRPRKYYQLTGEGIRVARVELAQQSMERGIAQPGTARPATGCIG
ncbi:PadR family transcriptional regulator [Streptomyces sp. H39-C1]|uniref:PadR family transcriptional regulator n=1 Tax=Streptomyces sp. H39-C1 TaxID=3004355 RepID=UPI0022AFB000|nr:helix-turn-helix transcriptional regulator [Streptomyces sp. H39-C1]MCZ4101067.1 helix-turn-helix transcriptional regulator [Streptomyces sp. H39-C1]